MDEFNEQSREYKLEKSLREKAENNESALRQRLLQAEAIINEGETERLALTQQMQECHEEIELKNELILSHIITYFENHSIH